MARSEGIGERTCTLADQYLSCRMRSRWPTLSALILATRYVTPAQHLGCDAHRIIRAHEFSMRPTASSIVGGLLLAHLTSWYVPGAIIIVAHALMVHSQLEDPAGNAVAFFRPTRPTRYQIGDVYGELHFLRNAGAGTIVRFFFRESGNCTHVPRP